MGYVLLRGKLYPEAEWWAAMGEASIRHVDRALPVTTSRRVLGRAVSRMRTPEHARSVLGVAADILERSGNGIVPDDEEREVVAVLPI